MNERPLQQPGVSAAVPAGVNDHQGGSLLIEGLLVGGNAECLDIVVTPYLLSLERGAVLDVETLAEPPLLIAGIAKAVRLRVRTGARLFGLSPSAAMEAKMWRRRSSFAVATRRSAPPEQTSQSEEQLAATRAFLARHGIDAADLDDT